jgi:excisionase family DNA binding protein
MPGVEAEAKTVSRPARGGGARRSVDARTPWWSKKVVSSNGLIAQASATELDGPLLRPEEAARLLSVKRNWIYEAVRDGRLPCLRVGRHIRFTRGMLEAWLADQLSN